MMELVIKIPEIVIEHIKDGSFGARIEDRATLIDAVINGTPLPKGHKRLIEDDFEVGYVFDSEGNMVGYQYLTEDDLNNAPTIIEADKGE